MRIQYLICSILILTNCQSDSKNEYQYYNEGILKSKSEMQEGAYNGEQVIYYKSGKIKAINYYLNNKLNGISKLYYPDGTLKLEQGFLNDKNTGVFRRYFENGNIEQSGYIVNGLRQGNFYHYFKEDSGKIKKISNFFNFRGTEMPSFIKTYDINGKLIHSEKGFDVNNKSLSRGELIEVNVTLNIPIEEYDSVIFVYGGYDEDFFMTEETKNDTLIIKSQNFSFVYNTEKHNSDFIQGELWGYKITGVKGDTLYSEDYFWPLKYKIE